MISIVKQMYTETAHRLINYDGRCAHLHGHSWLWEVEVESQEEWLDFRGMVADFKDLKELMVSILDPWDHALLLNVNDPLIVTRVDLTATNGQAGRVMAFPFNPTSENLVKFVAAQIQRQLDMHHLGPYVHLKRVSCKETASSTCNFTMNLR